MLYAQFMYHFNDFFGSRAAEFAQQSLDLGFHRHNLDAPRGRNILHLHSVEQIAHKAPLCGRQLGYVVDEKQQALFRAAQAGILLEHHMLHPRVEHRFAFVGLADVFEQLFIRQPFTT